MRALLGDDDDNDDDDVFVLLILVLLASEGINTSANLGDSHLHRDTQYAYTTYYNRECQTCVIL